MALRIQLLAILVTGGLFVLVLELVRRRRLMERYALLWLLASAVLLLLAVWRGLLNQIAETIGIYYAPSALFVIAFGFILVLLLHFSLAVSRLSDQNKILAQRLGILQDRLDQVERREGAAASDRAPAAETQPAELTRS
jgi:hypothetical protein